MIPQIIAHRGASYLAPENTLAAFRKAMEIGADGVEMDVQKTLDGGLVIHHDYIIDLHTDISGRIYDMTEGELKDLDFGSWKDIAYKDEKIATLAEALALCRSMEGCAVQLEMKSTMDNDPAFVSGVVDAIRAADIADRLVLISFNHDLLRQAKALMPELRVGVLLYGAFESMVLPPPVIWKDLGLVNGMEDEEAALDEELAALPVDAGMDPDEENGWMTRWVNDKVSMLRANFPGESLQAVAKHLADQHNPVAYVKSLDFAPEYVSCEYHTAYSNPDFIPKLQAMGIKVVMLTGDNQRTADAIGKQAGVDAVIAGVLPDGKEAVIRQLQAAGKVAMVGDGINDAPALTRADTGIAIGAGTDVAIDAADVVLMNSRLSDVPAAIRLSRATLRNIHENLFWAFLYNTIGIPLAAGAFIPFGLTLNPMFGAAAMSLSSFCVVSNALRLNLFDLHSTKHDHPLKNASALPAALTQPAAVEDKERTIKEDMTMKKTLHVEGMMCGHCEARVKKALEALPEVTEAVVSHETGTAVVTLSAEVSDDVLKKTVEDQDYKVTGIQ